MYIKIVDKEGEERSTYLDYGARCHHQLGNKKEAVEFAITWCSEFISAKSVSRMTDIIAWSNLNSYEPVLNNICQKDKLDLHPKRDKDFYHKACHTLLNALLLYL